MKFKNEENIRKVKIPTNKKMADFVEALTGAVMQIGGIPNTVNFLNSLGILN